MNYDNRFCFQWKSSEQVFNIILFYDNLPTKSSTCVACFPLFSPLRLNEDWKCHFTSQLTKGYSM